MILENFRLLIELLTSGTVCQML